MRIFNIVLTGYIMVFALFMPNLYAKSTTKTQEAIFAGGCFWCMEADFDKLPGVIETISGYTGGQLANPTYPAVSHGGTGHYEAVKVIYNPNLLNYKKLLDYYWHHIDPIDSEGQFCDKGDSYRSAIFYLNAKQKIQAEKSKNEFIQSGRFKKIATLIIPATTFYPAEDYHQDYYQKNPLRYRYYRHRCGRDQRIQEVWSQSA